MKSSGVLIEVLQKGVVVLEILADHPEGLSLHEIVAQTKMVKSSVWRLLDTWERLGYANRNPEGKHVLGVAAIELARKVARRHRLVELTHSLLAKLHEQTRESVYLGIYREGRVVLIDAIESTHALRVVVDLGEQCHLHASAQGRCVAAYLEPESLKDKLRSSGMRKLTSKTKVDPQTLAGRLEEVRREGLAINWEETVEGAVCLGAPVFAGRNGQVLGSLGLSIPVSRAAGTDLSRFASLMKEIAAEMSEALGGMSGEPDALSREMAVRIPAEIPAGRRAAKH
jgi:DNA-binding IclR family transcriptional regulator